MKIDHPTNYVGDVSSIAVGVPVFSRSDALRQFLESVPGYVATAYVADNGNHEDRADLYAREWPFELEVLELDYDVGIGRCRATIVDALDEPYLWMGDCDMEFVRETDLWDLEAILEANPGLGGVSGWLREGDTVRSGARDLVESGGKLYKTIDDPGTVEDGPLPFSRFEMIPQCGLFRAEAFETYSYDPDIQNTEHADFFYGHKVADEWDWASTPAVVINHHRDIDPEYRQSRGQDHVEIELLNDKWGITAIPIGERPDWVTTDDRPLHEQGFDIFRQVAPRPVWTPAYRALKTLL